MPISPESLHLRFVSNRTFTALFVFTSLLLLQACQSSSGVNSASSRIENGADQRPGFLLWTALELEQRNAQLGRTIRPDGSSRETLSDYLTPARSHRFRFIRRDRDGLPEQHDNIEDYVYIQSGNGRIQVGGVMLGRTGDIGTEIVGGEFYEVGIGDVLRIPAGIPHAYLVGDAGHITYVLTRVPAFRGEVVENPDGAAPDLDPPGFGLWRAGELAQKNVDIVSTMRTDGSSRATLADYGVGGNSHRIRFLRRDRSGWPELHNDIVDVAFVQSGDGHVLVGGEMIGESNVPGARINGGERHAISAGDVIHIPANMPHAYLTSEDNHITYVLVRVPAFVE